MNKIISILLILSMLLGSMLLLVSCGDTPPSTDTPNENEGTQKPHEPSIRIPAFGNWQRETVSFSELTYSRPNVELLLQDFDATSEAIKKGDESFEQLTARIDELDAGYTNFYSMYSLAEIYTSKNSSNEFWQTEYEYLSTKSPEFAQAVENMFVAAAQSELKVRFEEEYFGYSLEQYVDGGIYTDELVALLAREAELEAENSAISTSNITISYDLRGETFTGTVDEVLEKVKEKYGEMSSIYNNSKTPCMELYRVAKEEKQCDLYVELVKIRSQIATEMGYDNYTEIGYENTGHDYSKEEMIGFLEDIKEIYALYLKLWYAKLEADVNAQLSKEQIYIDTVNRLGNLYRSRDEELYDIYSFMLYYGLFDIAPEGENRFEGSFATYIDDNESPYVFITAENKQYDYLTLAHEFGHFADMYINYGNSGSLDLSEVSSQGLEYLTMGMLSDIMSAENHRILVSKAMDDALNTLLFQGFFAMFEHMVYELDYNEINREKLDQLVAEACEEVFGVTLRGFDSLSIAMIVHIIEYPFYVQSYCTSLVAALDIFFLEEETEGAGLGAYHAMLEAIGEDKGFLDTLGAAGIKSPLRKDSLIDLANDIHYYYFGRLYIDTESGTNTAAA